MPLTTHGETPRARTPSPGDGTAQGLPASFGRYRVTRLLGAGGMGAVYLAVDDTLGREVAVKTLRTMDGIDDTARQRFLNEARAVAALDHAHIVAIHDLGIEKDTPYIVMELARGQPLSELLADRGRLSAAEVCTIGIQMSRALARAHEAGIVHRDVKPGNILAAGPGLWKLADFGVARLPDSSLTSTGIFIGTPSYGAPEALTEGAFGPAGDVFSLGAVLYECLTGGWAQKGKDLLRAAVALEMAELPPPSAVVPGVAPALDAAVMAAVSRDVSARPTAVQLADALAASGNTAAHTAVAAAPSVVSVIAPIQPAPLADRRKWVWLAIAAMIVLVVGILLGRQGDGGGAGSRPAESAPGAALGPGWTGAARFGSSVDDPPWPDDSELDRFSEGRGKKKGKRRHGDKLARRWREAREVYEDDPDEAAHHVSKILDEDPDNEAAMRWLDWYEATGGHEDRED